MDDTERRADIGDNKMYLFGLVSFRSVSRLQGRFIAALKLFTDQGLLSDSLPSALHKDSWEG